MVRYYVMIQELTFDIIQNILCCLYPGKSSRFYSALPFLYNVRFLDVDVC